LASAAAFSGDFAITAFLDGERAGTGAGDIGRRCSSDALEAPAIRDGDVVTRLDLALDRAVDHEMIATRDLTTKADAGGDEQMTLRLVRGVGSPRLFHDGDRFGMHLNRDVFLGLRCRLGDGRERIGLALRLHGFARRLRLVLPAQQQHVDPRF
jgi:hypothetical protein